jgi:tripartite-type tricarboxylate transporter receptor subunit TctC
VAEVEQVAHGLGHRAALKSPEVIERLRRAYAFPEGGSPEEFTKFLADEGSRWSKLVKDANIKLE